MLEDSKLIQDIIELLSGRQWTPETLEEIASLLRAVGYTIEEPPE